MCAGVFCDKGYVRSAKCVITYRYVHTYVSTCKKNKHICTYVSMLDTDISSIINHMEYRHNTPTNNNNMCT